MNKQVKSVVAFAVGCLVSFSAFASDPFAGVWHVTATPSESAAATGANPFADDILFHDGQFSAGAFAMMGFTTSLYAVQEIDDEPTTFSVTLSSTDRGTLTWSGRRVGSTLLGTLVWLKPDGTQQSYALRGTRFDDEKETVQSADE